MGTSKYVTLIKKDNPPSSLSDCAGEPSSVYCQCKETTSCLVSKYLFPGGLDIPPNSPGYFVQRQGLFGLCVAMPKLNIKNVKKILEGCLRFSECINLK